MADNGLILKSSWKDDGTKTGQMQLALYGNQDHRFTRDIRLAYTAITRIPPETELMGARFVARTANYHELAPLQALQPSTDGLLWEILIPKLSHRPAHYTDGPKSAFLILPDGETVPVACDPFFPEGQSNDGLDKEACKKTETSGSSFSSSNKGPNLGAVPCVNQSQIDVWASEPPDGFQLNPKHEAVVSTVNALYKRLFPNQALPFTASNKAVSLHISSPLSHDTQLGTEGFRLDFSTKGISITASETGLFYALIALAQIWHAAKTEPEHFAFPQKGIITDSPAHRWRGMHLDVSRQVYDNQSILDFLDRIAWHRLNRFHWHLTDDEGWRLQSATYPQLTQVGAWRGHRFPLLPQHGSGAARHGGYFSLQDVKLILAHARALRIDIVPEIDVPGHCYAALMALPDLLDPSAATGGVSVQGYVNNALNPGLNSTWTFLETIFGEVSDLFPSPYVHMGGDEVAETAWGGSRAALSWANAKGYTDHAGNPDTMRMQAHILRFVSDRLIGANKTPLAWEEAAKGGGLDADKTILMAWFNAQSGPELAKQGYRVIMCPGEAYYLDMAQSDRWQEPGLSWAGTSSPEQTYAFDPLEGFGEDVDAVIGLQGCIWSENLVSRSLFNHMVFPRLSAIAESAWTRPDQKDCDSFNARSALVPPMPTKGD